MVALRAEADEAHELVDQLKAQVKTLEQENLSKEQEITSLNHRNSLLEEEVANAEAALKEAKAAASQSLQHDTQNEALQRRVQLLEEEAEENDKTLRETNEKYDYTLLLPRLGADILRTQASPNRHQGWPLRAEGAGTRRPASQAGDTVRGCDHRTQQDQEGTR
jgi:tropomyosin